MKKIITFIGLLICVLNLNAQTTLNEGFESWPPANWEFYLLGDALDGWRDDFNGNSHSGTESAYSSINNAQCDNWMVTPAISIIGANYSLKFWEEHDGIEYYDHASVMISSASGDPLNNDFVEVFESNILNTESWEERIIDLSAYDGQTIYVAFRHEGTWHAWNVDDVTIEPTLFTDGALNEFANPIGVSETPTIETVTVQLENTGSTTINDFSISWSVNSISQTPYDAIGLNLLPGQLINIDLGDYNFNEEAFYNIVANLELINDFDPSNNQLETTFDISSFKDGGIVGITPEGLVPVNGNLNVEAVITNFGINTIDVVEILWAVEGIEQVPFTTSNLNLIPGATTTLTIGSYVFPDGVTDISATLNALGDTNSANDQYEATAAINTFIESFEGAQFPPEGWSINFGTKDGINFDLPVDGEYYYVSSVDNNFFGEVTDTLYTPLLAIENGDHFTFYIKTAPPTPVNHTLVWKDGVTGEVNIIQSIEDSPGFNNWALRDIDISSAVGNNQIGIVSTSLGGYGESKFDFFTSDAELYLYDNDLKIINGDINFLAKQNTNEVFECVIKNNGAMPVLGEDYTVKLMEVPNIELASVNGVNLNSWEDSMIEINYTFSDIDVKRLYFEIEYAEDQNPQNNTFREADLSIVPNTIEVNAIGSPDQTNANIPFTPNGNTNSLGEDDMSQLLFYNDEFNSPGEVYGIAYKYDNLLSADHVVHYPLQVWIAQTSVENLDGGWLPNEELTLVFDGIVEILPGNNRDLYIPFDEPVLINGIENVVIKSYQYDPEWPPSIFRFYATQIINGPTRAIGVADVFDLDPEVPPNGFFSFASFTYTRFVVDPSVSYSELSGFVYDNTTNAPIDNSIISIEGSNISTLTNPDGSYTLPELPNGEYVVTASYIGYQDETISIDLFTTVQSQDFYLDPLEEVEVTGTVFGSNATSIPLESVDVSIVQNGDVIETVTTNENGDFIFPIVYGGSDYEVMLAMYGYYDMTVLISPVDINIELGNLILDEEFISPFDVTVSSDSEPEVNWKSPKFSSKVKLQQDLGIISYSYTNEPLEDVWLGNSFEITEITTLTSVEFRSDIYENAIDFVTIDIFDLATNEVIASSEPFLIQQDSLHTVDIPNIVVTSDVVAMIHWQNNAASTNSLAIDYSDLDIPNAAAIRYPGETITPLSVFFGGEAPNMSFLLRINTLDDGNPTTNSETVTYNVFRGLASEFPNISNWELLNETPLTDLTIIDLDSDNIVFNENYRYAVETIYNEGLSEVTFSNIIQGQQFSSVEDLKTLSSEVFIYPNPAQDVITIKLETQMQINKPIKVYDILGQEVFEIDPSDLVNGTVTTSVKSLDSGLYILKINYNGMDINKEFIKE